MKREDDIFRKLKNEKPLVKTVADAPPRRTAPTVNADGQEAPPVRRRIGSVPSEAEQPSARPQAEAPARRRSAAQNPDAPTRRRIISAEPAAEMTPEPAAEPQVPQEKPRRRMTAPVLEPSSALSDKVGGNSRDFAKPAPVAKDTAERKPLTYRHEEKYYISYADYIVLRQQLRALMHPDPHADENGEYYIRSLYLDDI